MEFFDGDDMGSSNEGGCDETAPFVKVDPFGTDTLSCYVRFATSRAGITSRQTPRDRVRVR